MDDVEDHFPHELGGDGGRCTPHVLILHGHRLIKDKIIRKALEPSKLPHSKKILASYGDFSVSGDGRRLMEGPRLCVSSNLPGCVQGWGPKDSVIRASVSQ